MIRRCLILTDIHANATALEAVFAQEDARSCDTLISLGDQINYGPEPRRVMDLLHSFSEGRESFLLLGNHEERLRRMEELTSYSWALLRWTQRQLGDFDPSLPTDVRLGPVLCTHGTPGDPYHLVGVQELSQVLDSLSEGVTHLLSGHNHVAWRVEHGGRTAFNPGSCGMLEEDRGGLAPYGILEMTEDRVLSLERRTASYDLNALEQAFVRCGSWREAPEFARVALTTMRGSEYHYTLKFMRHLRETAQALGLTPDDEASWQAADRTWRWSEPLFSRAYWKALEAHYA
ncbi:MAG: metallophosphoesterase [Clostridia bacterium]|nr:metallophosphoesterase [Clostridia bacterium]